MIFFQDGQFQTFLYITTLRKLVPSTDSKDYLTARKYWNKLKQRLKEEGNETATNCHQLKIKAADGKMRLTND